MCVNGRRIRSPRASNSAFAIPERPPRTSPSSHWSARGPGVPPPAAMRSLVRSPGSGRPVQPGRDRLRPPRRRRTRAASRPAVPGSAARSGHRPGVTAVPHQPYAQQARTPSPAARRPGSRASRRARARECWARCSSCRSSATHACARSIAAGSCAAATDSSASRSASVREPLSAGQMASARLGECERGDSIAAGDPRSRPQRPSGPRRRALHTRHPGRLRGGTPYPPRLSTNALRTALPLHGEFLPRLARGQQGLVDRA